MILKLEHWDGQISQQMEEGNIQNSCLVANFHNTKISMKTKKRMGGQS
jgi:hypothetical protein